jgi:hypothetical protein
MIISLFLMHLFQVIWFHKTQETISYYENRMFKTHINYIEALESRRQSLWLLGLLTGFDLGYLIFIK